MKGGMKRSGATLEEMKQALEGKLYIGKKIKKIVCFRESSTGPMQKDKKTDHCKSAVRQKGHKHEVR